MRNFFIVTVLLCAALVLSACGGLQEPAETASPPEKPEPVKTQTETWIYRILDKDGETGTHSVTVETTGSAHVVSSSFDVKMMGQVSGISMRVESDAANGYAPKKVSAQTHNDGVAGMNGTIACGADVWKIDGKTLTNRRGKPLDSPKLHASEMPAPEGVVLFACTFSTLGPRLLPEAGEMAVTYVKFPDPRAEPEILSAKPGRLVRTEPDAEGMSKVTLYPTGSDYEEAAFQIDREGKVVAMELAGGIFKLVLVEE